MEDGQLTAEERLLINLRDEFWRQVVQIAAARAWKKTYERQGLCSKDGILIFLKEFERIAAGQLFNIPSEMKVVEGNQCSRK